MDLPDLLGTPRVLDLGDGKPGLPVPGVSATDLGELIRRFPIIADVVATKGVNLTPGDFVALAAATTAIVAAGLGYGGSESAEAKIAKWPVGDLVAVLNVIWEASLPTGLAPFVELGAKIEGASASRGKAQDSSSPSKSKR